MKTVKIDEASETQLDWLVAQCKNLQPLHHYTFGKGHHIVPHPYYEGYDFGFTPTNDPAQMWPIIHEHKIDVHCLAEGEWYANMYWRGQDAVIGAGDSYRCGGDGLNGLIAAARCFVKSVKGETAEVPKELT